MLRVTLNLKGLAAAICFFRKLHVVCVKIAVFTKFKCLRGLSRSIQNVISTTFGAPLFPISLVPSLSKRNCAVMGLTN